MVDKHVISTWPSPNNCQVFLPEQGLYFDFVASAETANHSNISHGSLYLMSTRLQIYHTDLYKYDNLLSFESGASRTGGIHRDYTGI